MESVDKTNKKLLKYSINTYILFVLLYPICWIYIFIRDGLAEIKQFKEQNYSEISNRQLEQSVQ